MTFVSQSIVTIQIAGISLITWIVAILLIVGIIKLIYSLRPKINIRAKHKENDDE